MEKRALDNLTFFLRRSNRKTVGITIDRDGKIIVSAPHHQKYATIKRYILEKEIWVQQKLARKDALNREKPDREFVNGQGFLYLGKSYRLRFRHNGEKSNAENRITGTTLKLKRGYFELPEPEKAKARKHFIDWYKKKTEEKLGERIPRYANRVGVRVKKFQSSDLGNRWASYSRKGTISFNWRSVMAPIWVFDYILVHEMAHMIEHSHSKQFWSIVSRVVPDYEEYAHWLDENGADLDI